MKIKKLHPLAAEPTYATDGSACFDLRACLMHGDDPAYWFDYTEELIPGQQRYISTGLAFEVPEGHVMLIFSRSGHAKNHSVNLANCVGVIDSDYRGEVGALLRNNGGESFTVDHGERIAQALVLPVERVAFEVVDELSETTRGSGGFGSTGKD